MAISPFATMSALEEQRARLKGGQARGGNQVAAVNLMGLIPEVLDLARMSKAGQKLPARVPEHVLPGGVVPPGDFVRMKHYTTVPEEDMTALDPAMWGTRGASATRNAEAPRMQQNPDMYNTQFYNSDYPHTPEGVVTTGGNVRMIEGVVPGMYDIDRDPDNLRGYLAQRNAEAFQDVETAPVSGPMNPRYGPGGTTNFVGDQLQLELEREARRRGYSGVYRSNPGAGYGSSSSLLTPVDLTGAAPNIAAMRANLGLPVAPGAGEVKYSRYDPYAQVNTETMPGAAVTPNRYNGYKDSPSAGAMLHADMEQLLRDPDGGSVVARFLGAEDPMVRQAQGIYGDQRNPVAAARIKVAPPEIPNDISPDRIDDYRLSPMDEARLDAIAITEGMLRDQDEVAWTYPIKMTPEKNMASEGIPWQAVNSAVFRSSKMGKPDLIKAAKMLREMEFPDEYKNDWTKRWDQAISVTEPPDGGGGVMFTNVSEVPPEAFQKTLRELREKNKGWERYDGMQTEWGRAQTGFYENKDFSAAVQNLPEELRARVEETYGKLSPLTSQIKSYHDGLRKVANGEALQYDLSGAQLEPTPNSRFLPGLLGLGGLVGAAAGQKEEQ